MRAFPAVGRESLHDPRPVIPANSDRPGEHGPALMVFVQRWRYRRPVALKRITDEHVLKAIVEQAGDGYCLLADLLPSLPRRSHADRRRAVYRSVSRGLVLQRRGPDGRGYVAVASEGWRELRAA